MKAAASFSAAPAALMPAINPWSLVMSSLFWKLNVLMSRTGGRAAR
jgi:hypothetical protein